MATTTAPRKPRQRKPAPRSLRLVRHADGQRVLTLTVGPLEVHYYLRDLASNFGRAFELVKFCRKADEPAEYHVNLDGPRSTCECKGFLRHGHCKHLEGLQALVNAGKLPGAPEPARLSVTVPEPCNETEAA